MSLDPNEWQLWRIPEEERRAAAKWELQREQERSANKRGCTRWWHIDPRPWLALMESDPHYTRQGLLDREEGSGAVVTLPRDTAAKMLALEGARPWQFKIEPLPPKTEEAPAPASAVVWTGQSRQGPEGPRCLHALLSIRLEDCSDAEIEDAFKLRLAEWRAETGIAEPMSKRRGRSKTNATRQLEALAAYRLLQHSPDAWQLLKGTPFQTWGNRASDITIWRMAADLAESGRKLAEG